MRCIPSVPHLLSIDYVLQIILCCSYLVLIFWSAFHPGWWMHINRIVACGVAVTAFTITSMFYLIVHTHRDRVLDTPSIHRRALCRRFKFMCPALCGLAFIWAAIFAAMTLAPKGKDFRHLFDKPPHTAWGVAAVLAIVEVGMLALSPALVRIEERGYIRHVDYVQAFDRA
ncbi:MAG: hypothetical protein FRX48_05019 [Lasallia pustulata]|uniref:Uncharacterized protein n=1 Tax=Lasallia pustulata TaxID=136370 RepID=A0A5M8PQA5_9LECA|nr:MAG: hypothetical protein FRX48_05019 [Lasallia pustulata]